MLSILDMKHIRLYLFILPERASVTDYVFFGIQPLHTYIKDALKKLLTKNTRLPIIIYHHMNSQEM